MSELDEFGYSKDFKKRHLGDVAHIEMGQSPDSRFVFEDPYFGYPFLQGNAEFGIVSPSPKFGCARPAKLVKKSDVLISVRAPVGAVNIADRDYCIGRGLAGIRLHGVEPNLAAQLVQHQSAQLRRVAQGTTFEAISKTDLQTLQLRIPPDAELPVIADILTALDTAIHQTEAIVEKLKQAKQGLLHDLLTRGVDANGELRPSYEEAPDLYQESPLGWIPAGWIHSSVETEFFVDSGITLGQHRVPRNSPKPYLRVANVHRAQLNLDDIAFLEASDSEAAKKSLLLGDLLVVEGHASTKEIGRCAMVNQAACGLLFQNHLFRLRPKRLLANFSLLWMNSDFARAYWRTEAATSSGLNTINRTKLNILGVAVPSWQEQERITTIVTIIEDRIYREAATLQKIRSKKSGLMDDLLTGRVRLTPLLAQ